MPEVDRSDPRSVVLQFAKAYTRWERSCGRALPDAEKIKRKSQILLDYCTIRRRVYVDGMLSYGDPPAYVAVTEENIARVQMSAANRAFVDTSGDGFMAYRFVPHKKADGWMEN